MTGTDSLKRNLDVSSLNGQWLPWPEVARHHPQQVNAHTPVPLPQKIQNEHCPYAPHMRVSAPRRGTAFPTLEGTMAAWQEKTPVLPELRKVVTHCPKLDVAGRAAVPVEEGHECLVELCIHDERVFCHQSVLEELLQGLVVANGVFHCVNFQEGEGFFGMSVHRRCALGDKSPSLPTHVGIGLFLGGRRIGFVLLPLFRVHSSILQGLHLFDRQRFQRPEADVCAVDCRLHHAMSFQARQEQIPWGAQASHLRLHHSKIHLHKKVLDYQEGCLRNHVIRAGTCHVVWKGRQNNYSRFQSI